MLTFPIGNFLFVILRIVAPTVTTSSWPGRNTLAPAGKSLDCHLSSEAGDSGVGLGQRSLSLSIQLPDPLSHGVVVAKGREREK